MIAIITVSNHGKRVIRQVDIVLIKGFTEEERIIGSYVEARQIPGLNASQHRQGTVRAIVDVGFNIVQKPRPGAGLQATSKPVPSANKSAVFRNKRNIYPKVALIRHFSNTKIPGQARNDSFGDFKKKVPGTLCVRDFCRKKLCGIRSLRSLRRRTGRASLPAASAKS